MYVARARTCNKNSPPLDQIAALSALGRRALVPFGQLGDPIENLDAALVVRVEVLQAKLDRIDTRGRRKLVHEALVGEGILHASWGPDPGWAQRRRFKSVTDRPDIGELVGNVRVLEDVSRCNTVIRRLFTQSRRNQGHKECIGRLLRNEELRIPGCDAAGRVHAGPQIDQGRGALRVPTMSSARDHCTRTGRPTLFASRAASAAASLWPLRP